MLPLSQNINLRPIKDKSKYCQLKTMTFYGKTIKANKTKARLASLVLILNVLPLI